MDVGGVIPILILACLSLVILTVWFFLGVGSKRFKVTVLCTYGLVCAAPWILLVILVRAQSDVWEWVGYSATGGFLLALFSGFLLPVLTRAWRRRRHP